MSDTFEELRNAVPTLVFGAADAEEEAQEHVTVAAAEIAETMENAPQLSKEELEQVESFASQIDIRNTNAILNYGVGTQKKMADFSEKAIENVRTKDMGEVGDMLSSLVTQLKDFDVEEDKGLKGLFKKGTNRVEALKARYSKVETNVESIATELEKHQVMLMKDADVLDRMYDLNLTYLKELSMYIIAGKKKLEEERANELVRLQKKAEESGLSEDAQAAKDFAALCDRFEKKLYDLELTRTVSMQTAPQIRMVQNSDTMMAEKIQSTIVNTIPLWKNQMVIAIGVEHMSQAATAERKVNDMTNELLKKNADKLKTATVESAKESERGIVDIETLKHTNEQLISTIDEVLLVQKEGKERRAAAEVELLEIEGQLKQKLLEASRS
ncbi:MAG: toxic anion resistance protein [Lachnospiraceae bacterium]|nr:toxic anion resistance protein [Lachnospiraceae bacterium]